MSMSMLFIRVRVARVARGVPSGVGVSGAVGAREHHLSGPAHGSRVVSFVWMGNDVHTLRVGALAVKLEGQHRNVTPTEWRLIAGALRSNNPAAIGSAALAAGRACVGPHESNQNALCEAGLMGPLVKVLASDDPDVKANSAFAIGSACAGGHRVNQDALADIPEGISALAELVSDGSVHVMRSAATALGAACSDSHRRNQDTVGALPGTLARLASILADVEASNASDMAISDESPLRAHREREAARAVLDSIRAIGEVCCDHYSNQCVLNSLPTAVQHLAKLLAHPDPSIVESAAFDLGVACEAHNGNQDALGAIPGSLGQLVVLLEHEENTVVENAALTIAASCNCHRPNQDLLAAVPNSMSRLAGLLERDDARLVQCACLAIAGACVNRHPRNQESFAAVPGATHSLMSLLGRSEAPLVHGAQLAISCVSNPSEYVQLVELRCHQKRRTTRMMDLRQLEEEGVFLPGDRDTYF